MLSYSINTAQEGETIPEKTLRDIYEKNTFKDKRVIIHRDGPFRGDELKILNKIQNLSVQALY